jgi:lysophospholipase L1-like esterase
MAGGGYMGFSYPAAGLSFLFAGARPDLYTIAQSGTWTSNHTGQNQPDMGRVSSSSVGAKYTITFPAGHSAANLFYNNSAGAEVRYRWDGGSWTTLSLASGTFASLASVPTGSGTLEIEVVAGTCQLGGIDWRMSASGVRLHKLGASGGRASQFASLGEPNWRTSVANLGIDAAVLMLGINDKAADRTPTEFATDIQTIITRLRTMDSAIDILLVAEPETSSAIARPDIYTQAEYAEELATLAEANRCGFLDLQPFFGTAPSEYNFASSLALLQSDGTHVSEDKGAFIVSAALYDAIAG